MKIKDVKFRLSSEMLKLLVELNLRGGISFLDKWTEEEVPHRRRGGTGFR